MTAMATAYLGMGANLPGPAGPPDATLAEAARRLADIGQVTARSSLYATTPVGFADQPLFTNAVVALATPFSPATLLEVLLELERALGRNRLDTIANRPRTLDLDILLMGDLRLREPHLEIPHPRLAERAFVLVPLVEIAPRALDPRSGRTALQLLEALRQSRAADLQGVVPMESPFWTPGASPAARRSHVP